MSLASYPLLDKIVDLQLIRRDGTIDYITTPKTGIKQNISIKGHYKTADVVTELEVRIVNFYPSVGLDQYKAIVITAGYAKDPTLQVISGQVFNAYVEAPGPDGSTLFAVQIGEFNKWLNEQYVANWTQSTPLSTVFNSIAGILGLAPHLIGIDDINLDCDKYYNGAVKDAINDLKAQYFNLVIRMDSYGLYVFPFSTGSGGTYNIQYYLSAPRREAYGWTLVIPWIPGLRPGDSILVDTIYYKQNFTQFNPSSVFKSFNDAALRSVGASSSLVPFRVLTMEFEFSTVDRSNSMTIVALDDTQVQGFQYNSGQ
jgi:hypothetical protein